jgi:alkanesulfonate monooxygenase SsuD/methylene tetrahydromethanopterin reductase-like flavin-dependent oxidoreductase (luciferase family)
VRFSVCLNLDRPWTAVLDRALWAEGAGFDGLWLSDHLLPPAGDGSRKELLECWTTAAAIAVSVDRVTIGTLVSANTLRPPALVARMAATLDTLSGRRFILGLGAGGDESEHRALGLEFPPIRERLERLEEAAQMIRALLGGRSAPLADRRHGLDASAVSSHAGTVPLLIGGAGERLALPIVARHADRWCVWGSPGYVRRKCAILDACCAVAGRDPSAVARAALTAVFISPDRVECQRARAFAATAVPAAIVGSVDEVEGELQEYAAAGVDELVLNDVDLGADAAQRSLDTLVTEIAPSFRLPA